VVGGIFDGMIPPKQLEAKPTDKEYKISDGGGLHLLVTHSGGKLWRFQYRFDDKQKVAILQDLVCLCSTLY